jgi:hypothetical protein
VSTRLPGSRSPGARLRPLLGGWFLISLLAVVRRRVLRLLEKRGALPAEGPEDAKQAYQARSPRQRLLFAGLDVRPPPRKVPRCAFLEGFSLHANTHLHAHDREGLERLCRYGARGALALERFEEGEDGGILYRMKRPMPDGATHLRFTGLELLRRMAALVPPPRSNPVCFHGVFAPGAKLRPFLVPAAVAPAAEESTRAVREAASGRAVRTSTPRLDWAGLLERLQGGGAAVWQVRVPAARRSLPDALPGGETGAEAPRAARGHPAPCTGKRAAAARLLAVSPPQHTHQAPRTPGPAHTRRRDSGAVRSRLEAGAPLGCPPGTFRLRTRPWEGCTLRQLRDMKSATGTWRGYAFTEEISVVFVGGGVAVGGV